MSQEPAPTIAIFGAGPGLGAALARRFGQAGYRAALIARNPERLQPLVDELQRDGIDATGYPADLSDPQAVGNLVKAIETDLGPIDVLEYSPITGASPFIPAADLTAEQLADYLQLYVLNPITLIQEVLPSMLDRGRGAIVVTQGGSAAHPGPGRSGIGPAMAAMRNYLYSLHGEVADRGVYAGTLTVSAVISGSTGASALDQAAIAAAGLHTVDPAELATLIWDLIQQRNTAELSYPPQP